MGTNEYFKLHLTHVKPLA